MKDLNGFLGRFLKSLGRDVIARETVREVIKNTTRITLEEKDVAIKDGVLEITTSPAKKSEIMLKEKRILDEVSERTGMRLSRILYK